VKPKLFIVDDEKSVRESLRQLLSRDFFIFTADCARQARRLWAKESFDIVLLDILLPDCSGITLLEEFRKTNSTVPVIMITGTRQVKTAVSAMKLGAYDYLTKPFNPKELFNAVGGALQTRQQEEKAMLLSRQVKEEVFFGEIIGRSPRMLNVYKRIAQVMNRGTTVLILGESGTGKELIARAIHYHGIRRQQPFVPVHIASLSQYLIESELFGHQRGAFTGAVGMRKGPFETASGGTVFLDEIGDIPLGIQAKLLRVLQEREIKRVGGTECIKVNVRFIGATNRDLTQLISKGKFREDLYYRISVVPVNVPPLRERKGDIQQLAHHFIEKISKAGNIPCRIKGFTKESVDLLGNYYWPGNVRELENAVEQIMITADHQWILPEDLPLRIHRNERRLQGANKLEKIILSHERQMIEDALEKNGGVVTRAAATLGTSRRVLKYKIDKLKITSS